MKIKLIGLVLLLFVQYNVLGQAAASSNYNTITGTLGTTYSWIDCSAGTQLVFLPTGDDTQASITWPFNFNFYDNSYTTANSLSVASNGFIRLDGVANGGNYTAASAYALTGAATTFGQIIALGIYDDQVGRIPTSWVRSLVTGTAPDRVFTIEYNDLEIYYNAAKYADVQVSFYESSNKIVLKFGTDNVTQTGADLGIHSGVTNYFNKWQEVASGANDTWIEYTAPNIEVNATIGTSTANYPSLKGAFDKINDGTHQGAITIKINSSTTEGSTAVLNASGTGSSNYSSVNMYPTLTGLSINGNSSAATLIDLNGADNVTIDGRVNATGTTKDLSIVNSNTASTIRFINGATNNTVKYSTIKGSETLGGSGVLFFSTTTAGSGNSSNTIDNNNITSSLTANRPVQAIYSLGTSGKENSENIISNNNIFDFLKHATASNGILLAANTTSWTIDGNSFYETASFIPAAAVAYSAINISNTAGNNFTVSNNYIGGSAPACGGTPWIKTNANNNVFDAISLNVGSTTASSVQNNTIQNFNWSNSANGVWKGVEILAGVVNVGTIGGNTIGAVTGTGSITVTGGTTNQIVNGIYIASTGTIDCQNNTIGSIAVNNGATLAGNIFGIQKTGSAGTTTISNNSIGSTTTANSINASSASTANVQTVYGIHNAGTGIITITSNTISNINNGTTNTTVGTAGVVNGITSLNGSITISNNTIYDLSIANANTSATQTASVCGIALTGIADPKTITGNTIYNLSNTYISFAGHVTGLYFVGGTSANAVSENLIHSLSVAGASSTTANINGIKIGSGVTTYSNNIINLGGDTKTTVYGIFETGAAGNNNDLYFNTVYIGGSLASGTTNKSYALWSNASTNVRDFRNNIFMNARSTISGANLHYAAYYNYAAGTSITLDYNDYFVSGTGGIMGWWNSANKTSLPIITGKDVNSLSIDPVFTNPGGNSASDYFTAAVLPGVFGTGILADYNGITRNNPPKMGALESALGFVWQGNTSTNFATASNWVNGVVPTDGSDISFAATPANDCYLDQNRTLKNITNTSAKKFVVNGKQFTLTGNIISATANQIDASGASSVVVFAGTAAQNIPTGAFVSNTIDGLTLNNSNGLTQNGDITIQTNLTLNNGAFTIGANTLTLNGSVSATAGTLIGGGTSNISIGGSGASTTLPGVSLNNLTLNRSNGIGLAGNVSVGGTLALTSGTLTVSTNTLTISGNTLTRTSGNIDASNAGASLVFTNSAAITLPTSIFTGNINNLTINGAGITAAGDLSVDGVLDLQSANPSSLKGSLDMSTDTLNMGSAATTSGIGDVTGVIKRQHTFLGNVEYSFGNQYTTLLFINTGVKPGWVSCKVSIGLTPAWRSEAVKREYSFSKDAGTDRITVRLHYLNSELNSGELDESKLVFWDNHNLPTPNNLVEPHGKSANDIENNWVERSSMSINYLAPSATHDDKQWGLSYTNTTRIIWTGLENSGDWSSSGNWNGGIPTSVDDVLIPAGLSTPYPYRNLSPGTLPAVANKIEIETGASITVDSYDITVYGSSGAWINNGTFVPGTGKVIFDNTLATISGITNFYDVIINTGKSLRMEDGCVMRIAGAMQNNGVWHVVTTSNSTVEYNGGDQIVVSPNPTTSRYNDLVLSGSGIKTMPGITLNIEGDFILTGPVTATAASSLKVGGELEIQADATFATGAFDHTVGGHFDNAGTFTASAGTTITLNGTSVQNIYGGSVLNFENLNLNNAAGADIFADISVNNLLTLSSGKLNVATTTLAINGDVVKTSGFIDVNPLSSLTFGGTTALTLPASLFFTPPSINNLTINRTGGLLAGSDITINGVLNLQSANPSATTGSFETGSYTLIMGAAATTIGIGDVTGKIKRTTILPNVEYTFGNPVTSVIFPNTGTLPTEITLKVSIGTAPGWKTDGIKRILDISQTGGSNTRAALKAHYLDSELNGLNETNLSYFSYIIPSSTLLDRGVTEVNTTDNWLTLSNADFGNLPSGFGVIEHGFGVSVSDIITWDGSESTDWYNASNWTPAFAPSLTKNAVIPDAATTPNDPLIAAVTSSSIKTLVIQTGGVLNSGAGSVLTLKGSAGAWNNNGTFNAATGKVIFNHGVSADIVTIAGITDFYDFEVGPNSTFQPVPGSILRIAGAGIFDMTSIVDFSTVNNTVEWNGINQTIVNPNGIGGSSGYYNLILSGSGTKTMPNTSMNVRGDFSISGTASATAAEVLVISGNAVTGNGSTFTTGSFNHTLAGNFDNNGTFTSGGTITFNGTIAQTISGISTSSFDNLTIDNIAGVTLAANVNVNNALTFNNGTLSVGASTLAINGTVSNPSGNIDVSTSSNLSFGGTTALTINNNLFSTTPSVNNLTINRTGGVTLGNQSLTVNGVLDLQAGTLTLAANSLTIAGNTLTRTTGNINAGNTSATLAFTNSAAITLPTSVISGSINHLTVGGAGINAGGDITINGVLNLSSANQSATIGSLNMSTYTLNMGVSATTTGTGDVTGIVKRQHTFINDVEYSFGNQHTSLNFLGVPGGIKPSWVSCKIAIGTAPIWRSEAINRFYSFAQSGGTDRMIVKLHYLDSELHGTETDETKLVFWDAYDPALLPNNFIKFYPRNKNGNDATGNWIQLTGPAINYLATSSTLDVKQWGLSYSNVTVHTWVGLGSVSYPGDWSLPGHWDGGVPQATDDVIIPTTLPAGNSGYPYRNLLSTISPSIAQSIEIESVATLSVTDFDITVYGDGDAWVNNGSFNPGSGNVIFDNGDETKTVTISGTTNFNNLTITDKTHLHLATSSITRVAGILNAISGSVLDFTTYVNMVEYNGNSAQTVINPTGDANPGYHNLIFSGSGTKTLPASSLNIEGDLTTNATISASGNTLVMNGATTQTISGSVAPALNNLTISNVTSTVTASVNIDCSGSFTNSGDFDMTTYALAVASTVTNTGTVKTASVSATPLPSGKTWGGTVQYYATTGNQTVMAGTFNNLTLSNTSGTQTASGNLTVNATLITTSGGLLDMATHQLLGTLSAITNGGAIQTQNTSATPIPTGKTWGGTVQYNSLTGGQTAMAGTYTTLTLSNTSGTQTASGDITATTFNTTAGGTINMVTYALGLTNLSHSGILRTQNTSSTPFTSGKTWGGTLIFDGASGQTLPTAASIFNNLTISNASGVSAAANQTVNGILNLEVANPDATHGSLDMSTSTLEMGITGTTTGQGDVTGIVKRTGTFVGNVSYSFGNQYTTVAFINTGTKPSWLSCQIVLNAILPDKTVSVKRYYSFAENAAYTDQVIAQLHYLDSELNGNAEESLVFWDKDSGGLGEHGKTGNNTTDNWVELTGLPISYFAPGTGHPSATLWGLSSSELTRNTWSGTTDTLWHVITNWTAGHAPTTTEDVLIPAGKTNYPSLTASANAVAQTLEIESGASITANAENIDISGATAAWVNNGTFVAGTGTVTLSHGSLSDVVSISGTSVSSFYNLTAGSTVYLQPSAGSVIKIAGALTQTSGSILDFTATENTVEYNGSSSQLVIDPVGPGTDVGYEDLIISGGDKTFGSSLHITGEFINNKSGLSVTGTAIFTDNGDGNPNEISGDYAAEFENITLENVSAPLLTFVDISASGTLTINANTILQPDAVNTIGGAGTLTGSGTAKVTRIASTPDMATQYSIATKTLTSLTVDYCGAGNQTVNAFNYGNLLLSANGTRTVTLAGTGTIGVSGAFSPDLSSTSYTITGSTLEANGTGSQTVPAFNYYNVIVSGDRSGGTITLVNGGTIGIAGHSTVSATNANFVITNNTIDINGSEAQTIDPFSFYNVVFSNSGTKTTTGNLVVYGGFTVNAGSTLDMDAYTLSGPMSPISNSGTIKSSNTSAAPIPTGKTWGGTIEYTGSDAQTVVVGTFNNLTMSGAGGGTSAGDITMNGILNLSHTNPLSTKGILHTGSNIVSMGASATTIGIGDVTGIVKRQHTFLNEVEYCFGNQYTSLNFLGVTGGIKPTWVSCKIEIGTAPTWRSDSAVKRFYSFAQSGGTDRMIVKLHYLDSELQVAETDESKLVFWDAYDPALAANNFVNFYPRSKNGNDATNNWVLLTGPAINYFATSSTLDVKQWGLSYTNVTKHTWIGLGSVSYPGDWSLPGHWSGGVPAATDNVLILGTLPAGSSGYPSRNLLPSISPASAKTIEIESGAILNVDDYNITISGDANAWVNNGAFNAGTGTVVFNNGSTSNTVEIAGSTDFYNLTVSNNTKIQATAGSTIRIGGAFTSGSGSISDFITNSNTVEYNGSSTQTVVNPGASYGYHNLIFSSNGSKTLPSSTLNLFGNLTVNTAISATGNTLLMKGVSSQSIYGTNPILFNNLTIDNATGVLLDADLLTTIGGTLLINSGKKLEIAPAQQLTVSGALTNNAGATGFVLQSDATGTASLLHNTDNVSATVQRYISGAAEAWHFLSSSVSNQSISGSWLPAGTYGNGTGYDLYAWNEATNCWIYKLNTTSTVNWNTVHPGTDFVVCRGYLYSVQETNPTKEFAGYLNNGSVNYPLTSSSPDVNLKGFNLLGNPYPSSIDWAASSGWSRSDLVNSGGGHDMWIWNPAANNYGVCNSFSGLGTNSVTPYIAPMQGFFVLAANAGSLNMDNAVRVHDGAGNWFKNSVSTASMVSVVVQSEADKSSDEVQLQFGYSANEKGAEKLFSHVKTAPGLYTPYIGENYSVRYLTDTKDNPTVPVYFKPGRDGEYALSCNFENGDFEFVVLEDRQMNAFLNLKDKNTYNFLSTANDDPNRFVLHFGPANKLNTNELPARIYTDGTRLNIDLTLVHTETTILIYDALGRVLLKEELQGLTQHSLSLKSPPQILIIQLRNQQGTLIRKLFYQNNY